MSKNFGRKPADLGPPHRIAVGPEPHGTKLSADWLPFMPGTTRPYLTAAMCPPAGSADGVSAQMAPWQQIKVDKQSWRLRIALGNYALTHSHRIEHVSFSPDLRLLAVSAGSSTKIWDWQYGREIRRFISGDGFSASRHLFCTGRWLADWHRVFDIETGALVTRIPSSLDSMNGIRDITTTGWLIVTYQAGYWALVDPQTGMERRRFDLERHQTHRVFASPAGPQIAWVHRGQLRVWDDAARAERTLPKAPPFHPADCLVGFTSDGAKLVRYSVAQPWLDLIDAHTGEILAHWNMPIRELPYATEILADDVFLISETERNRVLLLKLSTGELLREMKWHGYSAWASRCGRFFAGPGRLVGQVDIYDHAGNRVMPSHENLSDVVGWAFAADSRTLCFIEGQRLHAVVPANDSAQTWEIPGFDKLSWLAVAADGRLAAVGGRDGKKSKVVVWDVVRGLRRHVVKDVPPLAGLQFTPDASRLILFPLDQRRKVLAFNLSSASTEPAGKDAPARPSGDRQMGSEYRWARSKYAGKMFVNAVADDDCHDDLRSPDGRWWAVQTRRGLMLLYEVDAQRK